jgi:cytochrome c-type biogenesis protein CcmH
MSDTPSETSDAIADAPAPRAGRRLWIATVLFSVIVAAVGYMGTGRPDTLWGGQEEASALTDAQPPSPQQIEAMVQRLAQRLKDTPDDVQGWQMLTRSYMILERFDEAAQASAQVLRLQPDDPNALADHADVLALKNGRSLQGEPLKLIERALRIDPRNLKALALAGAAAFDRGDGVEAARLWERVVEVGPPDSPIVQQAREGVAEARKMTGQGAPSAASGSAAAGAGAPAPAASPAPKANAAPLQPTTQQARVSGTVTLAAHLAAQADPQETLFIIARSAEADGSGGRMPLAVLRKQVKDLPLRFTLDDSLAMGPGMGLSSARRVVVTARVSRSGQAMPQAGDLEGTSSAVEVGVDGLKIEISRVVR